MKYFGYEILIIYAILLEFVYEMELFDSIRTICNNYLFFS